MDIVIALVIVSGLIIAAYIQGKRSSETKQTRSQNEILKEQASNDVYSLDDVEFGRLFEDVD